MFHYFAKGGKIREAPEVFGKPAPVYQKGMLGMLNFAFVAAHNRSSLNREWS